MELKHLTMRAILRTRPGIARSAASRNNGSPGERHVIVGTGAFVAPTSLIQEFAEMPEVPRELEEFAGALQAPSKRREGNQSRRY